MIKYANLALILGILVFSAMVQAQNPSIRPPQGVQKHGPLDKSVRFVYLVSADRQENPAYKAAIEMAARSIQAWYKVQLGTTFRLNDPVVEVAQSDQKASWFYAHANGSNQDDWGYNNALAEGARLLGVKTLDPNYIWVIYSDGPGNKGRGGSGVCIMPEDDLLGLIGQHPEQKDVNRWIAGLGHEAGHAFGLNHPADTEKDADAIMWTGIYGKYPDKCYLTTEDKEILGRSPFFFDDNGNPNSGKSEIIRTYAYSEGWFRRMRNPLTDAITWTETKTDGSANYEFTEEDEDANFYYLKSVDRALYLKIPTDDGIAYISDDDEDNWLYFQELTIEW